MKSITILILTALAALICLLGCNHSEKGSIMDLPNARWGSIQIVMMTDTLRFLPGDTAAACGFVTVKDYTGRVMPGEIVNAELLRHFGSLVFVNGQDTTDERGRVYICYSVFDTLNHADSTIIHAWIGSLHDYWTLWVRPSTQVVDSIGVTAVPDTLYLPMDSTLITICGWDAEHHGIYGITLPLLATGGRLQPLPPTDSSGCTHSLWFLSRPGRFCMSVSFGAMRDSACVVVMDTTGGHIMKSLGRNSL